MLSPAQKAWATRKANALLGAPKPAAQPGSVVEIESPCGPAMSPEQASVKFMKHYVTDGRIKVKVSYSRTSYGGVDKVTLYAKDYGHDLAKITGFADLYENNTDSMTDYFENGRVRIPATSPFYFSALERCS